MDYIDNQKRKDILIKFDKKVDKIMREIERKSDTLARETMTKVIKEISVQSSGLFRVIAYEKFQSAFFKYYGKNYDVNSLNKSLSFFDNKAGFPQISCDIKQVIINPDISKDKEAFNQNAYIEGNFDRLMDLNEILAVEDTDVFGMTMLTESPFEIGIENNSKGKNISVFKNKKIVREPEEVIEEAKIDTYIEFCQKYNNVIIKGVNKKYHLNLSGIQYKELMT